MASYRKRTNFESIQRRKSTMLPNVICVLTSWKTNITVHHQWHIKFVTKSAKCPTHMTKSIDYKCAMTVLGHFWSFSPKMFKQIVHPIYRISQLKVLYRIEKTCPIHSPSKHRLKLTVNTGFNLKCIHYTQSA